MDPGIFANLFSSFRNNSSLWYACSRYTESSVLSGLVMLRAEPDRAFNISNPDELLASWTGRFKTSPTRLFEGELDNISGEILSKTSGSGTVFLLQFINKSTRAAAKEVNFKNKFLTTISEIR